APSPAGFELPPAAGGGEIVDRGHAQAARHCAARSLDPKAQAAVGSAMGGGPENAVTASQLWRQKADGDECQSLPERSQRSGQRRMEDGLRHQSRALARENRATVHLTLDVGAHATV